MTKARENSDYTGLAADIVAGDTAARAGRKNLIINGGFDVSQRGDYTSATSMPDGYYLDRWVGDVHTITANIQHLTAAYGGGTIKTQKLVATSSATGILQTYQYVEDFAALSGREMTLSARVKSNATGYRLQIYDGVSFIDSASGIHTGGGGWEALTLTFTPSTSSTSLEIRVTNYNAGLTAITSGDYIEVANVQLELGSVATDFEHRSYGEILADCQRYFERLEYKSGQMIVAHQHNDTSALLSVPHSEKRSTPSVTLPTAAVGNGTANAVSLLTAGGSYRSSGGAVTADKGTKNNFRIVFTSWPSSGSAGDSTWCYFMSNTGTSQIDIDAEL